MCVPHARQKPLLVRNVACAPSVTARAAAQILADVSASYDENMAQRRPGLRFLAWASAAAGLIVPDSPTVGRLAISGSGGLA